MTAPGPDRTEAPPPRAAVPRDGRFALLLLCFALSGLAGLVYQTAWAREFSLVFGTSELAVATVLAAYMGGLAAGAAVAARWARRVRRPVLAYGLLELGIAVAALALPLAMQGVNGLLVTLFGRGADLPEAGGLPIALFYVGASFAVLLVPTGLMGATLPLLTRHAVRHEEEIGARAGLLYAANTGGAVGGTLLAGFVLLPALGLRHTIYVAVAANVLVFAAAAGLARHAAPPVAAAPASAAPRAHRGHALVLVLIGLSGLASFTYEVLWTRLLGQVLGGTIYAFSTMLAAFLTGIALGSTVASRLATDRPRAARAFAAAQLGTATLSLAAYALVASLPALARGLQGLGLGRLATDATLAMTILLPAALCIGATFPLAVRLAARDEADAGPASGRVYAANTAGAIVGAVGTAFFLVPAAGFAGTLSAAVGLNLALAVASAALVPPVARRLAAAAAVGLVALAFVRPPTPWTLLMTGPLQRTPQEGTPEYLGVGRSTTVVLLRHGFDWQLFTNGLPEAWIQPPEGRPSKYRSRWLPLLPHLARPEAESMLVIGLGGAMFAAWVAPGFETVDVIELEPEVVEANRLLSGRRRSDPFTDPRIAIHENDARAALHLSERRWDVIVSQPSHPWTSGASHLFTLEFFRLAREHLRDDGVLVEWMHAPFIDEPLLRSMLATLGDVFPHVRLYAAGGGDLLLLLASPAPLDVEQAARRALAAAPELYDRAGIHEPEDLAASLLLDEDGVRRFAGDPPRIRDDRNLLQMRSGRLLGRGLSYAQLSDALAEHDPWAAAVPEGLAPLRIVRRLLETGDLARARRIVQGLPPGPDRDAGLGLLALATGGPEGGHLAAALRADPGHEEARAAVLQLRVLAFGRGSEAIPFEAPTALERAVADGLRLERRRAFEALAGLEPALAPARPGDPLWGHAARLRATWRVESGDPARGREAIALAEQLLRRLEYIPDLILRARAALLAGEPAVVRDSVDEVVVRVASQAGGRAPRGWLQQQLRDARSVLAALPAASRDAGWAQALEARLDRVESSLAGSPAAPDALARDGAAGS